MQGRIQIRTRDQFKAALNSENSSGSSEPGSRTTAGGAAGDGSSGAAGASEADLRALFDSIDVDGSGTGTGLWHCSMVLSVFRPPR